MKLSKWLMIPILMCIISGAQAQDLSAYKWEKRAVLIFADKESHLKYANQMRALNVGMPMLDERDVVVLVDTKPTPPSPLRLEFLPGEFLFVLVGKDGTVKHKSNDPVSMDALIQLIDAMPMRKQEMESGG